VSERHPDLLFDYLVHALTHAHLNQFASQFGQPLVSGSRIYPVHVLVPPKDAQREFVARAAGLRDLKCMYEMSQNRFDVLFTSLQHRVFRGEL
jgi:type I restriction enzyme S subunit